MSLLRRQRTRRDNRLTKQRGRRRKRQRALAPVERLEQRVLLAADINPWHNAVSPMDVDGNGEVTPADVLQVYNDLNLNGSRTLPGILSSHSSEGTSGEGESSSSVGPMLDVNGDFAVTPADGLAVVNFMNAPEGENPYPWAKVTGTSIVDEQPFIDLANWDPAKVNTPRETLDEASGGSGPFVNAGDTFRVEVDVQDTRVDDHDYFDGIGESFGVFSGNFDVQWDATAMFVPAGPSYVDPGTNIDLSPISISFANGDFAFPADLRPYPYSNGARAELDNAAGRLNDAGAFSRIDRFSQEPTFFFDLILQTEWVNAPNMQTTVGDTTPVIVDVLANATLVEGPRTIEILPPSAFNGAGTGSELLVYGSNHTTEIVTENGVILDTDPVVPENMTLFANATVDIVNTGVLQVPSNLHSQLVNAQGTQIGTVVRNANSTFTVTPTVQGPAEGTFTYALEDGNGNSKTATVAVTITELNDPPVISVVQPGAINEDDPLALSGLINFQDPDAQNGDLVVTFQTSNGSLSLGNSITGTLAELNAAVQGATFQPAADFHGQAMISILIDDQGNTGNDGAKTDTSALTITVQPVNDAPVNQLNGVDIDNATPGQTTPTNTPLVFSQVGNNRLSIVDVDGNVPMTVHLNVTTGSLFAIGHGSVVITGNNSANVDLTGLRDDINSALSSVTFTPPSGFDGVLPLTITTNDQGNSGLGGQLVDTDSISISVDPPSRPLARDDSETVLEDSQNNVLDLLADDVSTISGTISITHLDGQAVAIDGQIVTASGATVVNKGTHVLYTSTPDFNGQDTFTYTIAASDVGDGPDTGNVTVTVTPINDPPSVTIPNTTAPVDEDGDLVLTNRITVADVDADVSGGVLVTLQVSQGTLTAPNGTVTLGGSGTSVLTIQGLVANVNASLNGLIYSPNGDYSGPDTLSVTVEDQGNTGGGNLSDTASIAITVNPKNDPPEISAPTQSPPQAITDEDVPLSFTNGLSIDLADKDAGVGDLTVSLAVTNGSLVVGGGVDFSDGNGSDGTLGFSGTLDELNIALSQLTYTPADDYNGGDSLTINVDDNGNTGDDGNQTAAAQVPIIVNPVNDPVVAQNDGVYSTNEDTPLTISIPEILQNDSPGPANEQDQTLTLLSAHTNNSSVVIVGDSLVFTPTLNYNGLATVTYTVQDNPLDGTAPTQANADITIDVIPVNDDPTITAPSSAATKENTDLAFAFGTGNEISVSDVDSSSWTVGLHVTTGTLHLASPGAVTIIDGANGSDSMKFTANSASALDAALNGMIYRPATNFEGNADLAITAADNDAGEAALTVQVIVSGINDPPENLLPGDQQVNEDAPLVFSQNTSNAITIEDVDAGGFDVDVAITVTNGTFTLNPLALAGLTLGGNGTGNVTVRGPLANINAALDGAVFRANDDFNTHDTGIQPTLIVTTNDNGQTGEGGAKSDTDSLTITVNSVNDDPAANDDFSASDPLLILDSAVNNPISVLDNDEIAPDVGEQLTIIGVTDGQLGTVTHDGSQVFYTPNNGLGIDTFTYTISDGHGGTDTAIVTVQVVDFVLSDLSGYVYLETTGDNTKSDAEWGIGHVKVTLAGIDVQENAVSKTAWTGGDGSYRFENLLPSKAGTSYTLTEHHPVDFVDGPDRVGDQGGQLIGNDVISVSLPLFGYDAGVKGEGNNFAETALVPSAATVPMRDLFFSSMSGSNGSSFTANGTEETGREWLIGSDAAGNLQWYINVHGWDGYVPGQESPSGSNNFVVSITNGSMIVTDTITGQTHSVNVAGKYTEETQGNSWILKVDTDAGSAGLPVYDVPAEVDNIDGGDDAYTQATDSLFSDLANLFG